MSMCTRKCVGELRLSYDFNSGFLIVILNLLVEFLHNERIDAFLFCFELNRLLG